MNESQTISPQREADTEPAGHFVRGLLVALAVSSIVVAGFAATWFMGFFHPPVEGYYRSQLASFSTGYFHLHDGSIDTVNIGGPGGDWRMRVGTYRALEDSGVEITFVPSLALAAERVTVGWPGFDVSPALAYGMPDATRCRREFRPWQVHKLNEIK